MPSTEHSFSILSTPIDPIGGSFAPSLPNLPSSRPRHANLSQSHSQGLQRLGVHALSNLQSSVFQQHGAIIVHPGNKQFIKKLQRISNNNRNPLIVMHWCATWPNKTLFHERVRLQLVARPHTLANGTAKAVFGTTGPCSCSFSIDKIHQNPQ